MMGELPETYGLDAVVMPRLHVLKLFNFMDFLSYGIMNEHQVAIGESTCAARFWSAPATAGGLARIEVREMSKIGKAIFT